MQAVTALLSREGAQAQAPLKRTVPLDRCAGFGQWFSTHPYSSEREYALYNLPHQPSYI